MIEILTMKYKDKKKKKIEKELGSAFIRINPDEKMFNIFKGISEIHWHIKNQLKVFSRQVFKKTIRSSI